MLRFALIAVSVAMVGCVAVLFATGHAFPGVGALVFWGVVLFVGVVFERRRYKRVLDTAPGPDWTATDERFIDPTSGVETVVYVGPRGARAYVKA